MGPLPWSQPHQFPPGQPYFLPISQAFPTSLVWWGGGNLFFFFKTVLLRTPVSSICEIVKMEAALGEPEWHPSWPPTSVSSDQVRGTA